MYYDHGEAMHRKECLNRYNELKKFISSTENGILNEWHLAYQYMTELEIKLEQQKSQIEEYRLFFESLQRLLPRQHSIHDVIG